MSSTQTKYISKLSGSRVLVLGGTSGIGFCIAEAAIEHGANVTVSGSSELKLSNAISRLQNSYPDAHQRISGQTCDLSQPDRQEQNLTNLLNFATSNGNKLDHIAFTAGDANKIIPVAEVTPEHILKGFNVRLVGGLMLAKLAPKYLNPGTGSSITFTSASTSVKPLPDWTIRGTYAAAQEGMMRGLAVDLAPVRVNIVSVGAVPTERWNNMPAANLKGALKQARDGTIAGEVGKPEWVAESYIYLMKDRFITGSVIRTDGGRLLV